MLPNIENREKFMRKVEKKKVFGLNSWPLPLDHAHAPYMLK